MFFGASTTSAHTSRRPARPSSCSSATAPRPRRCPARSSSSSKARAIPDWRPRASSRRRAWRGAWPAIATPASFVSPLTRTRLTAEPIAAACGLEPAFVGGLREVNTGELEGGNFRIAVADGDPIIGRLLEAERWDVIPGAEPMDAFEARVRAAAAEIVAAGPGAAIVVTHGGVVAELCAAGHRQPPVRVPERRQRLHHPHRLPAQRPAGPARLQRHGASGGITTALRRRW